MTPPTKFQGCALKECERLKNEMLITKSAIASAKDKAMRAQIAYRAFIARTLGASIGVIELGSSDGTGCEHVYDLREEWPLCVFCGSPKYGE